MVAGLEPAASRLQHGADPYMEIFSHLSELMEELNQAMIETRRLSVLGSSAEFGAPDLAGSLLFLSGDVSHLDDRTDTLISRDR